MRRVLKWTVSADDQWHPVGSGPVALVDVQGRPDAGFGPVGRVTLWTVEDDVPMVRAARVYGTNQPVPADAEHLGSCQDGPLVWHLFGIDMKSSAVGAQVGHQAEPERVGA